MKKKKKKMMTTSMRPRQRRSREDCLCPMYGRRKAESRWRTWWIMMTRVRPRMILPRLTRKSCVSLPTMRRGIIPRANGTVSFALIHHQTFVGGARKGPAKARMAETDCQWKQPVLRKVFAPVRRSRKANHLQRRTHAARARSNPARSPRARKRPPARTV